MGPDEIVDLCRRHSLFEWGTQNVEPIPIVRGEGCYLYTADDRRILDFNSIAMNVNIGHGDQRVTAAVAEQMANVAFVSPFMATEVRARVGEKLAEVTPPGMTKSFFTLAGADANEVAIRTARLVTGRQKILPLIDDPAEFRDFNLGQIAEIIELEAGAAAPPHVHSTRRTLN